MPESDKDKTSPSESEDKLKDESHGSYPDPEESPDVEVDREGGDESDAVLNAPDAAKPGGKGDPDEEDEEPDMKDMGVGPRPVDDQSAE